VYVPPHFQQSDLAVPARSHSRRRARHLVASCDGLIASHVPLMLDAEAGPNGTLIASRQGHPQAAVPGRADALAIFQGPRRLCDAQLVRDQARKTGKVVRPGTTSRSTPRPLEFFDGATELLDVVTRLTNPGSRARRTRLGRQRRTAGFHQGAPEGHRGFPHADHRSTANGR